MLKKWICTALTAACILMGTTAFASIPDSELSLGGITVGSSADYVKSLYGEPDKDSGVRPGPEGNYYEYLYGSSLRIHFDANNNTIVSIFVTANNGFSTPAGITVGMDADVLTQLYGEPFKNDRGVISYHEDGKWLVFVTRNGKIVEIKVFNYAL